MTQVKAATAPILIRMQRASEKHQIAGAQHLAPKPGEFDKLTHPKDPQVSPCHIPTIVQNPPFSLQQQGLSLVRGRIQ